MKMSSFAWMRTISSGLGLAAIVLTGCASQGIGDPCVPESIPTAVNGSGQAIQGFAKDEVYLETGAVQCRSRVCMVYKLQGNPSLLEGTEECTASGSADGNAINRCVQSRGQTRPMETVADNSLDRVYCSCRCAAEGIALDTQTPVCSCTDGFHCRPIVNRGGEGFRGGYCVPDAIDPDFCNKNEDCTQQAGATCDLQTNLCSYASGGA